MLYAAVLKLVFWNHLNYFLVIIDSLNTLKELYDVIENITNIVYVRTDFSKNYINLKGKPNYYNDKQ